MTIDEAIAHEKELAKEIYVEAMLCHANPDDGELDDCIQRGKYHEQLAEWLEELKTIKEMDLSIPQHFTKEQSDWIKAYCIKRNIEFYNKAIDDFVNSCKSNTLCQTFGLRQCDIDELAERLKAGGMNNNSKTSD